MKVIYLTYDGLLDPLGPSQILPYVRGISEFVESVDIISFEKKSNSKDSIKKLSDALISKNIRWKPLIFSANLGFLGKIYDLVKMYIYLIYFVFTQSIDVVHARGHVAAKPAYFIKKIFFKKFIFDFRGLWADERVDKGSWNLANIFDKRQYLYFKAQEKKILKAADQIVILTEMVKDELIKVADIDSKKITIIPCCADFNHFTLQTSENMLVSRKRLSIPNNAFVISYLGSFGSMYMIDDFLKLFSIWSKNNINCGNPLYALIITRDILNAKKIIKNKLSPEYQSRVIIKSATRDEMPKLIHSIDVLICFITSTYARIASSPTKVAECLAAGVPVISNSGIGDLEKQLEFIGGGKTIKYVNEKQMQMLAENQNEIKKLAGRHLRQRAEKIFGLTYALSQYKNVYSKL